MGGFLTVIDSEVEVGSKFAIIIPTEEYMPLNVEDISYSSPEITQSFSCYDEEGENEE